MTYTDQQIDALNSELLANGTHAHCAECQEVCKIDDMVQIEGFNFCPVCGYLYNGGKYEDLYRVIDRKYGYLVEKITALQNKAVKLGLEPIHFEVLKSEMVEESPFGGFEYFVKYYTVAISGEAPQINGWSFVARLDHTPTGNLVRSFVDYDLPEDYRESSPYCDHCKQNRFRTHTYVLVDDSGNFQQVGSSCLKDFTGHRNAEAIAEYYSMFNMETILLEIEEKVEHEDDYYDRVSRDLPFRTDTFFAYVLESVREHGYYKTSEPEATSRDAFTNMVDSKAPISDSLRKESREILSAMLEYIYSLDYRSDYMNNLKVLLERDWIVYREIGFVASIAPVWHKIASEKAEKEANPQSESQWIGEIGDKLSNLEVTLVRVFTYEKEVNWNVNVTVHGYEFQDDSGNLLVWHSSNFMVYNGTEQEIWPGDKFNLERGTVVSHDVYGNRNQTKINRCKLSFEGAIVTKIEKTWELNRK